MGVCRMTITQPQEDGHIPDRYHSVRGALTFSFVFSLNHDAVNDRTPRVC